MVKAHIIIGMLPQHIIIGMPEFIIAIMRSQHSLNISIDMPSIGFTSQVMPLEVKVQLICAIIIGMGIIPFIIGIMPAIIGIGIGIMAGVVFIVDSKKLLKAPCRFMACV